MRRLVSLVVLVALLLGALGWGVSAEMTVTATYQDGALTLTWNGAPNEFSLVSITVEETSYSVIGEGNSATVPMLLTKDATGVCTFSNGSFTLEPKPTFSVTADLNITSVYDPSTQTLSGTWTGTGYTTMPITHVRVDETEYPVSEIDPGSFSADLSALTEPGTYRVSYVITAGGNTTSLSGDSFTIEDPSKTTVLKAEKTAEGEYTVTLTDEAGTPLAGAAVVLFKDEQFLLQNLTDIDGKAIFYYTFLPDEEALVSWRFDGGEINEVLYKSSTVMLKNESDSTTSTTGDSFTTVTASTVNTPGESTPSTTKRWPTFSSIKRKTTTATTIKVEMGGITTGRYDTGVMVNALYDSALLKTFGIKASQFNEQARLYMEQASYEALSKDHASPLTLSVVPTEDQLADSVLSAALENNEEYGFYDVADAQSFAVSLSIAAVKSKEDYLILDPLAVPQDVYTVYLPVPKVFQNCDLAVISLEEENPQLIEAIANNGSFSFEIDHFGSYAVVAFPAATRTLSVPTVAVVLFVLAGMCLIAAGLVFYFLVIRSSRKVATESGERLLLSYDESSLIEDDDENENDSEDLFDDSEDGAE